MRCSPVRCRLALTLSATLLLAACGGGSSTPAVVNQSITPCFGAPPTPAFDVWQANFAPPTPGATPQAPNTLKVSVDTVNAGSASEFRLTVACQGTVVIPATISGEMCPFPPPPLMPGDMPQCPSAMIDLNDFGFAGLRRVGCLVEIGPTQPLGIGVGICADPTQADYQLRLTLNDNEPLSLNLAAHNCQAASSCLQDVFGINVGN